MTMVVARAWRIVLAVAMIVATGDRLMAQTVVQGHQIHECGRLGIAFHGESMVVQELEPGGPAQRAGLRVGDRVIQFGDTDASRNALLELADTLRPGTSLRLLVRRGERQDSIDLVAAPSLCVRAITDTVPVGWSTGMPRVQRTGATSRILWPGGPLDTVALQRLALTPSPSTQVLDRRGRITLRSLDQSLEVGQRAIAGAEFNEMEPGLAAYFEGVTEGLLVLRVAPETPAARADLRPGDVLVRADETPVREIAQLRSIVAHAMGEVLPVTVVREGRTVELRFFER